MPALPLDDAGPYVAGAFLVFFGLVLVYLAIMASKLGRIERELCGAQRAARRPRAPPRARRRRRGHGRARPAGRDEGGPMSELLAVGTSHKTADLRAA